MIRIALLPGDGIGTEVMAGPIALLREEIARRYPVEVTGPWPVGASALATHGTYLPPETVEACEAADAILLGAVGEHPGVPTTTGEPERALLDLRRHFDLRVSIREIWRDSRPAVVVLRNLLGGAYGGVETHLDGGGPDGATDILAVTAPQVTELAEMAVDLVGRRAGWEVLSVDKANLWATSRLWRREVARVFAARATPVEHVLVDRAAFQLADDQFDRKLLLTEGIFGDILSDLVAGRSGSIALCSSASVCPGPVPARGRCVGLFEPVHGSAPRHAGADRANPCGAYLALAAALDWFPPLADAAAAIRSAVQDALLTGPLTYDLAPPGAAIASCSAFSDRVNALYSAKDTVPAPQL